MTAPESIAVNRNREDHFMNVGLLTNWKQDVFLFQITLQVAEE